MSNGTIAGNLRGFYQVGVAFDPANIATATTTEQTVTVPGVLIGDTVIATKPTVTAGIAAAQARVSAANTVAITFVTTTTNIDAPLETYLFTVFRPEGGRSAAVVSD